MAAVELEDSALSATGWVASDSTRRYWKHPARYGEAFFDKHEIANLESNEKRRGWTPRRAPACRCRHSYGRLEEGICWKCGRRAS